jgi:hypothetical protein
MGAGADAGKCSGNVALGARNGDAGCRDGNLAVVIFTSTISDQGCVFCCRDSPTYLLAIRSRFSGRVHSCSAGSSVKTIRRWLLAGPAVGRLARVGLGIRLETGALGSRPN